MIELKSKNNFYVLTGGPSVGKTSLLEELQKRGYETVPEIARELIKEQQETNGNALPWNDKRLYQEMMFKRSIESFQKRSKELKHHQTPVLFDRSFLDAICYAHLIQVEISQQMHAYAENWRYNKHVFILPPWQEIYETDNERKQDWNEAVLTFEKMSETYQRYGYNLIELPKVPVNERADIVSGFIDPFRTN